VDGFLDSVGQTLDSLLSALATLGDVLYSIELLPLAAGIACFAGYQLMHSRASFNALRAAYPGEDFSWRRIWAAYVTAFGLNGIVPAGGGSFAQIMLVRRSIPGSSYPTVVAALCTTAIFDGFACTCALAYGFAFGFPKLADFAGLSSFDLAWIGRHPVLAAAVVVALLLTIGVAVHVARRRVAGLGDAMRQGLAIVRMPRRMALGMWVPQAASWTLRFAGVLFLLEAFGMPATARAGALVLGAQVMAMIVPVTPGGAGAQQAILFFVFAGAASADTVTAFSVGQQVALVAFTLVEALLSTLLVFRMRSLRQVLRDSRREKAAASLSPP
jgi:uncharacterized membrane protein YbhN (UPF0104 family)